MFLNIIILIIGFVFLIKSSEYMIDSASKLAAKFKVPPFIIGFSIIAFGTSAPELIIGILSGISKTNQITMGDVLGSAIANVALVIGVISLIKPIEIERAVIKKEIPLSLITQVFLMILLFVGGVLSRWDGIILLFCFAIFLLYIFTRSKESVYIDEEDTSEYSIEATNEPTLKLVLILIISIAGVVLGGNFVVSSATGLAREFGISELMIGLTVVAVGTSLPELITSIMAILKNKTDIAVGNIIGSNIFNVLFILGVSSVIHPITKTKAIEFDFLLVFGATIILFLLSVRKKQLKLYSGIILLLYYIAYISIKIFEGVS